MKFEERRSFDVRQQTDVLRAEFKDWRNGSNPNTPLEKHHTQIRRITGELEQFLDKLSPAGAAVDDGKTLEGLLFVHRTWAYFRDMFALRAVRLLQDPLKCADELAWECYRPLWEKAREVGQVDTGKLKEPPLIFFSSNASPFIQRRDTPFKAEGVTADDMERFNYALSFLPIPIVGVPWFQVNHLPAAVVIGHEVGHAVERDFHIVTALNGALAKLPEAMGKRREAWSAWRSELFADTYGILCTGPAHLFALSSFLLAPQPLVTQESVDWNDLGSYPTRSLRIAFNVEVLKQLGLNDEGLAEAWQQAYPHHTMAEYDDFLQDIPAVAALFLATPVPQLGGVPVADIIKVTAGDWDAIKAKAKDLAAVKVDEQNRFRRTIAAAAWAYYADPAGYLSDVKNTKLSEKLAKTILSGVRGPARRDPAAEAALRAAQDAADKEAADTLAALILG